MISGFGVGFRQKYRRDLLQNEVKPDWLELLADNHASNLDRAIAVEMSSAFPIAIHTVGMNLGGTAPIDLQYCRTIAELADDCNAAFVSDHLAFTAVGNRFHHDLWPMPRTIEAIEHLSKRIKKVHSVMGRPLFIENISTYVRHDSDQMSEQEFLHRLSEQSGCGFILDLNNLAINEFNHGESAMEVLTAIDPSSIAYVHIAGGELKNEVIVDTHSTPPTKQVLELLKTMQGLAPDLPVLLEWDSELPSYSELMKVLSTSRSTVRTDS